MIFGKKSPNNVPERKGAQRSVYWWGIKECRSKYKPRIDTPKSERVKQG